MNIRVEESPVPVAADSRANVEISNENDSVDGIAGALSSQAKWNAANPKAMWAHQCLRSAERRGPVTRQPCEVCGADEVDGHHDDYDKPLAVRWLCRLHHRRLHAAEKEDAA